MAKTAVKKAAVVEKKKAFGEREIYKYDVNTLADDLGILPASVRVALRKNKVAKAGKSYGWDTRADYDEILELLQSDSDTEKPAKGKKPLPAKGKAKGKAKDEEEEDEAVEEDEPEEEVEEEAPRRKVRRK